VRAYYDRRATEYDDWYLGIGRYRDEERPGWQEELAQLKWTVAALPPCRVLDVACGTGFLTRHLRGDITGLDQSEAMLDLARAQAPHAAFVRGDALRLPFPDRSFDRLFTGHFYGHLDEPERTAFLEEVRRVAPELVVVDSALHEGVKPEAMQERFLTDGSRHEVFKRYFTAEGLADELGGGTVLHEGHWFVVVRA
jgi:ubiquinone/menaquinone biosynthesis C-methylase UbiE